MTMLGLMGLSWAAAAGAAGRDPQGVRRPLSTRLVVRHFAILGPLENGLDDLLETI